MAGRYYDEPGQQNPGMSPVSDEFNPRDVIRAQPMHGSRDLHGSRDMAYALGRHDVSMEKAGRPWVRGSMYLAVVVTVFCNPLLGIIAILIALMGMRSTDQNRARKMMLMSAITSAVAIALTVMVVLALVGLYASRTFDVYKPRY